MDTFYVLKDGCSDDGRGTPKFNSCTMDPTVARKFLRDRRSPFDFSIVIRYTDNSEDIYHKASEINKLQ